MQGEPAVELGDGLSISPLGVGAWAWGTSRLWGYGGEYGRAEVEAAFRASIENGVDLVDTAEIYGNGESERIIGRILREGNFDRKPIIASKFAPLPYRLDPRSLHKALDRSLARLGLETLDLYQIHFHNPLLNVERLMDALAEAVKEGKVRHVGVSNYSAEQMRRAHDRLATHDIRLSSNQVQYSLLSREPETNGVLDTCRELGVTLIAYSPLAQGLLSGKYGPGGVKPAGLVRRFSGRFRASGLEEILPLVNALRRIGDNRDKTPSQVALNWLITQQNVLAIPGAKNEDQALQNAGALGWALTPEDVGELDQLTRNRRGRVGV